MAKKPLRVETISPTVLSRAGNATPIFNRRSKVSVPDEGARLVSASAAHVETLAYGSGTDVGRSRTHNEDALLAAPPLFVVADGMGGHAAGEVASELAIQTISQLAPAYPNGPLLVQAINEANRMVFEAASNNERRTGMGTTVTAALLQGTRLVIGQVGDSRAYLLHDGALQQLTRDHSLMQDLIDSGQITPVEARIHPQRNFITRALGTAPTVDTDLYELNVSPGDRLLLCSDGLSGMLEDSELASTLTTIRDPQRCVKELIRLANRAGGSDNITAIVVDVSNGNALAEARARRRSIITAAVIGVVALALIVGALFAMKALAGA